MSGAGIDVCWETVYVGNSVAHYGDRPHVLVSSWVSVVHDCIASVEVS